jgi:queuine tRNA-ribosyltransferase
MIYRKDHKDSGCEARTGQMFLPHGPVKTPVFMPVGTNGSVKAVRLESLTDIGVNLILGNTYHLYLRPGMEAIKAHGGLHGFNQWNGNILTDSGGYQVFSLARSAKSTAKGLNSGHISTDQAIS